MPGFTFVGRETPIGTFRTLLERPEGELLVVAGPEGSGKSHLLRRFRREAESSGLHFVQLSDLGFLPNADYRHFAVISELAAAQSDGAQAAGEARPGPELLPEPQEFLKALLTEDRRPPEERLLRVFSAASDHLSQQARFVLLVDLGRATGAEAFPFEYLARRLPEKIKLVAAVPEVPEALRGLAAVSVVEGLPALTEGEVEKLLSFHLAERAATPALVETAAKRFPRQPMAVDLAAKIAASTPDPAGLLGDLPVSAQALCSELLTRLDDEQRRLVECVARVPTGVDIGCLRALTEFSDAELGRLLRSDGIRNAVITQRSAHGPQAHLCHELLADVVLEASPDEGPAARTFHQLAAALFRDRLHADPTDAVALAAHGYHLRLSGDKAQFIHDFPRTYRAKHSFRLLAQLAEEYERLIQYCDELGETPINRPACLANLGRVLQELGRHRQALERHREALDLYEAADDPTGTAEQLANIATALQSLGELEGAIEHLARAAQLDEAAGNTPALAADLNNLGILYQQLARHDEALASHQRALDLHQQAGNDHGCANQLANMAAIHRARGDLHAACQCYQKAWVIDSRTGDLLAQVNDLCNLGLVFQDLGDLEKAILSYRDAIDLDRRAADREAEATHLRILAGMYIQTGEHDEAIATLQEALEVDRSLGNPAGAAADLGAMAAGYRAVDELDMARDLLERAAALYAEAGDEQGADDARRSLDAVDRKLRGEDVDETLDAQGESKKRTQVIQREPAAGELWGNLQIVDEDGAAPPSAPPQAPRSQQPSREPAPSAQTAAPPPEDGTDLGEPALPLFDDGLALEGHEEEAAAPFSEPAGAPSPPGPASDIEETLRRQRDEALRRVTELEAELESYKQLVHSLRSIVGEADVKL